MKRFFLFAGETSGDLHGSKLIQALQERDHHTTFCGVGGPHMRQEEFDCFFEMENFQVMGFSDVLKSLPHIWKLFYAVRDKILKSEPECVILIDYPGFNLRLARSLRKQGYKGKLIQYICPTVWAHGKKRIKILTDYFDLLLTIFPFETSYFSHTSLRVEYIGNPLVETIRSHAYQPHWMKEMGLPEDNDLIALFPGSRLGEIERHVPQQLQVAAQLKERYPYLRFAMSCAQESFKNHLHQLIQQSPLRLNDDLFVVPPRFQYELMKNCKTALAKSGTVTLELALHAIPTVVHYELSTFNYLIAKYILQLRLPYYCIVNILSQKKIYPEMFGRQLSSVDLKQQVELLHFNPSQRQEIEEACEMLQQQLGYRPAHKYAAKVIWELM
jgi:lipid-A-disaccharide synthase